MTLYQPEEFRLVTEERLPGLVANEIAEAVGAAPTVVAAAAAAAPAAVTAEIAARDLLSGSDSRVPSRDVIPGLSIAALDARGNRTRLEANDVDGGPTPHSLSLDGPALKEFMGFLTGDDPRLPAIANIPGISVALLDALNKPTWLQANDTDGGPTPFAISLLQAALGVAAQAPTVYVADGDSITQGGHGGGAPLNWPAHLATLLGKPVINRGRSGTTGVEAAMRQGGFTPIVTIPGGVLPGTGATVPATLISPVEATDGGLTGGATHGARTYDGMFDGVPAQLTENTDNSWTIKRTDGIATDYRATPRTPFIIDGLDPAATRIFWPGRNDYPKNNVVANIDKMAKWTTDNGGRFLVLSILTRSGIGETDADNVEIRAVNNTLQLKYPRNFVNIRDWLVQYGVEAAGLSPTQADLDATAIGAIPPALMADSLHPNAAGRKAIAIYVYQQLVARNWA